MPRALGLIELDDRARRIPGVPAHVLWQNIHQGRSPPRWPRLLRLAWIAVVGAPLLYFATVLLRNPANILPYLNPRMMTSQTLFMAGVYTCLVVVVICTAAFGGHVGLSVFGALLAAHGRCGACGFNLLGCKPEPDGCAVCPECGAAWHTDRATLKDADLSADPHLYFRASKAPLFPAIILDDRTVPLSRPALSLSRWIRATNRRSPALDALRDADRMVRRKRTRIVVIVVTLAWLVIAISMWTSHVHVRDRLLYHAGVPLGFAAIGAVLAYAGIRYEVKPEPFRQRLLDLQVCPNCREDLPEPGATPRAFDGCTACRHCGRAWWLAPGDAAQLGRAHA